MLTMKIKLKKIIAENVSRAADAREWSSYDLGEHSGTNQTTMARLMRARPEDPSPKIDTIECAVNALKVEPWAVMLPGCSLDVMRNKRLTELLIKLNEANKETIDRVISNALDTLMLEKMRKD